MKPYVKRQTNDAADAEAICEAVSRPTMPFVPVKARGAAERNNAASHPPAADAPADSASLRIEADDLEQFLPDLDRDPRDCRLLMLSWRLKVAPPQLGA